MFYILQVKLLAGTHISSMDGRWSLFALENTWISEDQLPSKRNNLGQQMLPNLDMGESNASHHTRWLQDYRGDLHRNGEKAWDLDCQHLKCEIVKLHALEDVYTLTNHCWSLYIKHVHGHSCFGTKKGPYWNNFKIIWNY